MLALRWFPSSQPVDCQEDAQSQGEDSPDDVVETDAPYPREEEDFTDEIAQEHGSAANDSQAGASLAVSGKPGNFTDCIAYTSGDKELKEG